jgi:hypothetical protein
MTKISDGFEYSDEAKVDLRARARRAKFLLALMCKSDKSLLKRVNNLIKIANED